MIERKDNTEHIIYIIKYKCQNCLKFKFGECSCGELWKVSIDLLNESNFACFINEEGYVCNSDDPLGLIDHVLLTWNNAENCIRFIECLNFYKIKYKFDDYTLQEIYDELYLENNENLYKHYDSFAYDMTQEDFNAKNINFNKSAYDLHDYLTQIENFVISNPEIIKILDSAKINFFESTLKSSEIINSYLEIKKQYFKKRKTHRSKLISKGYNLLSFEKALEEINNCNNKFIKPINKLRACKSIRYHSTIKTESHYEKYYIFNKFCPMKYEDVNIVLSKSEIDLIIEDKFDYNFTHHDMNDICDYEWIVH